MDVTLKVPELDHLSQEERDRFLSRCIEAPRFKWYQTHGPKFIALPVLVVAFTGLMLKWSVWILGAAVVVTVAAFAWMWVLGSGVVLRSEARRLLKEAPNQPSQPTRSARG